MLARLKTLRLAEDPLFRVSSVSSPVVNQCISTAAAAAAGGEEEEEYASRRRAAREAVHLEYHTTSPCQNRQIQNIENLVSHFTQPFDVKVCFPSIFKLLFVDETFETNT